MYRYLQRQKIDRDNLAKRTKDFRISLCLVGLTTVTDDKNTFLTISISNSPKYHTQRSVVLVLRNDLDVVEGCVTNLDRYS